MALSTYWISQNRKDLAEKAIVAKRERDAVRTRKCLETDSYHKQLALKSSKYRSLEEAPTLHTPRANDESSVKENQKFAKKERLEDRKHKLAHIFAIENEQYMKELKALQESERDRDPWNISRLKEQIEDLQRKRREGEQNMQKRYMHHLFNANIPTPREEKTDEQFQKEAAESWMQRKEELEKLSMEKLERERERCRALELEQLKASQEAREVEISQLEEQEQWSALVESKVARFNEADNETKKLKNEKQILIGHLETLLSLQNRREAVRDLQRKTLQRMQVLWQPKEKLRRILVEVQHGLDFDSKLLTTMSGFNGCASEESALALIDLECVADVKSKLEMQIALERQREVEIQLLYHEEATRVLEKKLEQWSLEAIARDEIMGELFKSLTREINSKLELTGGEEQKFLREKEVLLREIECANARTRESVRTLEEKQRYFADRARRMGEELETLSTARTSRPPSSSGRSNNIFNA